MKVMQALINGHMYLVILALVIGHVFFATNQIWIHAQAIYKARWIDKMISFSYII